MPAWWLRAPCPLAAPLALCVGCARGGGRGTGEQRGSCSVCRVSVPTSGAAGVERCKQHEEKVPLASLAVEVTACLQCTQLGCRPAPPPIPCPPAQCHPVSYGGVTHRFLAPFPCAPRWALCLGWADLAVPAVLNASAATALVLTPQLTTWLLYIYFFLIPPYFLSHSPKGVGSGRCLSPPRAPAGHHPEMHTAQEGCLCPAPHSATILPSFPAGSRQYLQLAVCCGIPRLYSALCRCSYRICSLLRGREENFS